MQFYHEQPQAAPRGNLKVATIVSGCVAPFILVGYS